MKYAVHCPTQQDYDTLMQAYEKKGWTWVGGDKPTAKDNWPVKKSETAVDFHDKCRYGRRSYQIALGYAIITLKEALAKLNMPRTIEQVQKGDLLKSDIFFYRVLDVRGEGELALVDISNSCTEITNSSLKRDFATYTLFQLKERDFALYEPEETIEVLGKKYKADEVKERLSELEEVE